MRRSVRSATCSARSGAPTASAASSRPAPGGAALADTSDDDRIFLETTRRLAPPQLAVEDARLAWELAGPAPGAPVADLGCGYGRHLAALRARGDRDLIGIDRSPLLLREAHKDVPSARLLRADLRALPLRAGSLGAAFCFYSSMFLGTDADAVQALREAGRALVPAARLVLTTDNPLRLAGSPKASFAGEVPGLGRVSEVSAYDPAAKVDSVTRTLARDGCKTLSATFRIRYYLPVELAALARAAGLVLLRLEPDAPLSESTPQLVAVLARSA
ncbi:MAG: hypothetical protein NVS2B9_01170 [Myxococcales bacterium]